MADRYLIHCLAWGLLLLLLAGPAQAEPGFDRGFGLNGRVAVELGLRNSGHAVVVQADGKIVVAGSVGDAAGLNFSLLRFNRDGSLDPSFNGDGSVTTRVSPGDDEILALGLLADGRIIAAGYSHNGADRDFALACYRPDGSLDPLFGQAGLVLTAVGNRNEEISALTIDGQDRITVAGAVEGTAGRVLATARYDVDGELDPSYGESGLSLVGIGADVAVEGMIKRPDGTLVVAGSSSGPQGSVLMLVGLSLDGILDRNFGVQGVAGAGAVVSEGFRLALDSQGRLLVAGSVGAAGKRDAALFRFTADGKADAGFGVQGVLVTRVSEEDDVLFDLTLGKTGLVASGYTTVSGRRQFLLLTTADPLIAAPAPVIAARTTGLSFSLSGTAPVEQVRVNGKTRVQVRRLQIAPSYADYLTGRPSPIPLGNETARVRSLVPVQPVPDRPGLTRLVPAVLSELGSFFLPSANAEEGGADKVSVVTASFSEGESIGYAVTIDGDGRVIVVGSAQGPGTSSLVAARFVDRAGDSQNQAGVDAVEADDAAGPLLSTTAVTEVTQTTALAGGEIDPGLAPAVVRRGLVFSAGGTPVFPATAGVGGSTTAVLAGEVAAGSGSGSFAVTLTGLQPATTYSYRAYALAGDGTVAYGNQLRFATADSCFVATASFGTLFHPSVKVLRDFRDTFLLVNGPGRRMVAWYYRLSPPLAEVIGHSEPLRLAVRLLLLPVVGFSWLTLRIGMAWTLLALGGAALILAWGSTRVRWRR